MAELFEPEDDEIAPVERQRRGGRLRSVRPVDGHAPRTLSRRQHVHHPRVRRVLRHAPDGRDQTPERVVDILETEYLGGNKSINRQISLVYEMYDATVLEEIGASLGRHFQQSARCRVGADVQLHDRLVLNRSTDARHQMYGDRFVGNVVRFGNVGIGIAGHRFDGRASSQSDVVAVAVAVAVRSEFGGRECDGSFCGGQQVSERAVAKLNGSQPPLGRVDTVVCTAGRHHGLHGQRAADDVAVERAVWRLFLLQ